jgi:alkylation response protein AidB-like acyl-CoA dehydrogenase
MDFDLTPEQLAFRKEVRDFIASELTAEAWATHRDPTEHIGWSAEFTGKFRRKLGAAGYIGMGWPAEYGGGGKGRIYQTIFWDEMTYSRAPGLDRSITYVPNALMAMGTEEQKKLLLPGIIRGELSWFVGYSEPEAGSDLANIKTQAVEDGDYFVITGQKSFSSDAHKADYGWVATRSEPGSVKHKGLSMFIVDMKLPGVKITEHPTMAGWTHHAVYFDNVRVHKSMLVGKVHEGWKVVMGAIDFERGALAAHGVVDFALDRMLGWCSKEQPSGTRLIDDPVVQDDLVKLAIESEGARLSTYWLSSMVARGLRPQHETSYAVLVKRETARKIDIAAMDLLGPYAPLRPDSPWVVDHGHVEEEYRDRMYYHFAAGGFDITRNVIALRGLGLPR